MVHKKEDTSQKSTAEWFCLRTQTKREHIASAMLSQIESIETFCPRITQVKKTRTGKKRFVEAMFPGYIFARFVLVHNYRRVLYTQGVQCIVGQGKQSVVVPEKIVEDLRDSFTDEMIEVPDLSIEPGAQIEFVSGSLKGLNGKVLAQLSAKDRIRVLIDFLGNEMAVDVDPNDVLLAPKQAS